jgi:hypothetical protein
VSANSSRLAAVYDSPGRKSGVDKKKENNSALPKAVAGEQGSEATQIFRAFVKAGQRLAEIHYEQQPEYSLIKTEKAGERLDYRATKMKLSKDKPCSSTTSSSLSVAFHRRRTNTA